jgi:hypothetical protein
MVVSTKVDVLAEQLHTTRETVNKVVQLLQLE